MGNIGVRNNPNPRSTPPTTGSPVQCGHKWVYQETHYSRGHYGYNDLFIKVDIYYCEKCLEQKEVRHEEYARDIPIWWRH